MKYTMKPWKKAILCALGFFAGISLAFPSYAEPAASEDEKDSKPKVEAEAAILMEANSGAILYEKNMDKKEYPASITKIMTGLLALENSSLDETVKFSHNAVFSIEYGSTHIGIRENEELTMEQCLYGLILASANEVANGIGEHVGKGSLETFAQMMNDKAAELGCTNTHFVNPNGLHDDNHYTTAHDMALITQEAIKNDTFRKIMATYTYVIPPTNVVKEKRPLQNHHKMLPQRKYPYDGCFGGKTGYTDMARQTLVTCAEREGMTLICVIMKSETPCYDATKELLDYGFEHFKTVNATEDMNARKADYKKLLKAARIDVKSSSPYLTLSNEDSIVIPNDLTTGQLTMEYVAQTADDNKEADNANVVGHITYTSDGNAMGSATVIMTSSKKNSVVKGILPKESETKKKHSVTKKGGYSFIFSICLMLILLLLAVLICFYYNRKRR